MVSGVPPLALKFYCMMGAIWPFMKRFSRKEMIWKFGLILAFFNVEENNIFESCHITNFKEKLAFFIFEDLAFLKLLMDKFGLLNFFGAWQASVLLTLSTAKFGIAEHKHIEAKVL
jgi:hypothetical protein